MILTVTNLPDHSEAMDTSFELLCKNNRCTNTILIFCCAGITIMCFAAGTIAKVSPIVSLVISFCGIAMTAFLWFASRLIAGSILLAAAKLVYQKTETGFLQPYRFGWTQRKKIETALKNRRNITALTFGQDAAEIKAVSVTKTKDGYLYKITDKYGDNMELWSDREPVYTNECQYEFDLKNTQMKMPKTAA